MIDIDPAWYFHPRFVLDWRCPRGGERAPVPCGSWHLTRCPDCADPLTGEATDPARNAAERRSA